MEEAGPDLGSPASGRCVWPAEKTLSPLAWPEQAENASLREGPHAHVITEPGKVPSPVFWGLQAQPKEDEQLLSPRWADERRRRARVR